MLAASLQTLLQAYVAESSTKPLANPVFLSYNGHLACEVGDRIEGIGFENLLMGYGFQDDVWDLMYVGSGSRFYDLGCIG